jgi:O-antigen/teichoic acid export membrane protein
MIQKLKTKYTQHKETIHNFSWRVLQTFGKSIATFLIFILCAKLLTPYDFGIYNYALAIVFFLIIFGDFGISTATSKYVAEYNVTDKNKLKSVLFNSGIIILGLTIFITILTLLFGKWYLQDKYIYALYLLPLIFLAPMTSLYDGIYRGLKRFKQLAIISIIVGISSLPFVYVLIKTYGLMGALIAQNLLYLILLCALALGYREFHLRWDKEVMKQVTKYSIVIGIADFGYFLFTRINTLILGHFNLIIEIGYYELINKIFMVLVIPFVILAQVIAPNITELYSRGKFKEIKSRYIKYGLYSLVFSTLLAIIVWITFPILLKFFLNEYNNSIIIKSMNLLLIVIISQSLETIAAVGFSTASGHAKLNMYWLLLFGILNIILSMFFVKNFGFIGIIYSTVIIKIVYDITFIGYYYIKLRFNIK